MPLAMHCSFTGLCMTTDLSDGPVDLIAGGTAETNKDLYAVASNYNIVPDYLLP